MTESFIRSESLLDHVGIADPESARRLVHDSRINLVLWPESATDELVHPVGGGSFFQTLRASARECLARRFPRIVVSTLSPDINQIRDAFSNHSMGMELLAEGAAQLAINYGYTFPDVSLVSLDLRTAYSSVPGFGEPCFHKDGPRPAKYWRLIATADGPSTEWLWQKNASFRGRLPPMFIKAEPEDRIGQFGTGRAAIMKIGENGVFHRLPLTPVPELRTTLVMDPL